MSKTVEEGLEKLVLKIKFGKLYVIKEEEYEEGSFFSKSKENLSRIY